jgi:hypothetical protein
MYGDTTDVEHEMNDCVGNNWSYLINNERFKEKCGNHTEKTFNRFTSQRIVILGTHHT